MFSDHIFCIAIYNFKKKISLFARRQKNTNHLYSKIGKISKSKKKKQEFLSILKKENFNLELIYLLLHKNTIAS